MGNTDNVAETNCDIGYVPKKFSKFWRVLFISAGIGVVVIILLSLFFSFYIFSFERSQPEHVIKEFLREFDHIAAAELIDREYGDFSENEFETRRLIIENLEKHILSNESFFVKRIGENTAENPVYTIFFGDCEIARVAFSKDREDIFGFSVWSAPEVSITADFSYLKSDSLEIVVPVDSTVEVNGVSVSDSYLKSVCEYEIGSKFEDTSRLPDMNIYSIEGLYCTPEISVKTSESEECIVYSSDGRKIVYDYPESMKHVLTFVVPENSSVTVNRQKLDDTYITEKNIPYENLNKWNETFEKLPMRVKYVIPSLLTVPEFSVTDSSGMRLEAYQSDISDGESLYVYDYPDSEKINLKLVVPCEAELHVNGVFLGEEEATERGVDFKCISGIDSYYYTPSAAEKGNVYILDDLYAFPSIKVISSEGDELLPFVESGVYDYRVPESAELKDEHGAYVETFVDNYIKYYTEGNANTYYNFTNFVLPYVLQSSEASNYLWQAYYTLSWSPQSSVKSKTVMTYNYQKWSEKCFSCYVDFDLEMNTYYDFETSVSGWQLFFVKSANGWKISKMIYH